MAAYRNTAANTVGIHKFYPAKTQEGRLKKRPIFGNTNLPQVLRPAQKTQAGFDNSLFLYFYVKGNLL